MDDVQLQKAKSVVWRLVRVFLAGFIASISVDVLMNGTSDVLVSMLKGAIAGGIASLFKFLRDEFELENIPL